MLFMENLSMQHYGGKYNFNITKTVKNDKNRIFYHLCIAVHTNVEKNSFLVHFSVT